MELAVSQLLQAVAGLLAQLLGLGQCLLSPRPPSPQSTPPALCILVQVGVHVPGEEGPPLPQAPCIVESRDNEKSKVLAHWGGFRSCLLSPLHAQLPSSPFH